MSSRKTREGSRSENCCKAVQPVTLGRTLIIVYRRLGGYQWLCVQMCLWGGVFNGYRH